MKHKSNLLALAAVIAAFSTASALTSCSGNGQSQLSSAATVDSATGIENNSSSAANSTKEASATKKLSESDIKITETIENTADGEHAVTADGTSENYSNVLVNKSGEAQGDEADFYGENSAIFAANKGTLDLSSIVAKTNGTHANAVFSYGEGTTVNISDSYIETSGNCSGGLMTTGGGTMNADNLTINTSGNSSAAIRSDRGGGTVTVNGGNYTTSGVGSPVIYSTADITVNDSSLESTASQGVVVEGKNSVTLNNSNLTADNTKKNGSHSNYYQAVMIYQSMSGDAAQGLSSFDMNGGTLTNKNGDVFFITNTATEINLNSAKITNESDGVFLRAAAAGWGSEGSNGGQVSLNASKQTIDGDMIVDSVSHLNLYLKDSSSYSGAVNSDGQQGEVYVEIESGSTWTLTGDSYITSLTCDADSINLNGHTLYVNGQKYTQGSKSQGQAIEVTSSSSGGSGHGEVGTPPEKPDGNNGGALGKSGKPDAKPDN